VAQGRAIWTSVPSLKERRNAPTAPISGGTSSLVGLDSLEKLCGADPRFLRHSIYHHALVYRRKDVFSVCRHALSGNVLSVGASPFGEIRLLHD
jgi:hypothetical protein